MVEDDGAVGPTIMVDQTQVGEQTYTNSLQASLVTQGESITLDLHRQTDRQMDGGVRKGRSEYGIYKVPWFISEDVFHIAVYKS